MKPVSEYKKIVVLTGAGVSAESGLKTFRDSDGLWEGHRVEDVATPEAFASSPTTVHRFYNARRTQLLQEARPNTAHVALAKFEQAFQGDFLLVTQNVDNLHEQAGSQNILHMHGELLKSVCTACGSEFDCRTDLSEQSVCDNCASEGSLRPDIVWFGEMPKFMNIIEAALQDCDLFVSIGTSGHVYPAAGFVQAAHFSGADTLELNLENTRNPNFTEHVSGQAGTIVPRFFLAENA